VVEIVWEHQAMDAIQKILEVEFAQAIFLDV
jgi:hypothetical protein